MGEDTPKPPLSGPIDELGVGIVVVDAVLLALEDAVLAFDPVLAANVDLRRWYRSGFELLVEIGVDAVDGAGEGDGTIAPGLTITSS